MKKRKKTYYLNLNKFSQNILLPLLSILLFIFIIVHATSVAVDNFIQEVDIRTEKNIKDFGR